MEILSAFVGGYLLCFLHHYLTRPPVSLPPSSQPPISQKEEEQWARLLGFTGRGEEDIE